MSRKEYNAAYYEKKREYHKKKASEYYYANRETVLKRCKEYQKESGRTRDLKKQYGITEKEWNKLFEAQNKQCAICGATEHNSRYWQTDHCHTTDRIRGILCGPCNWALGLFKDDANVLKQAIKYLETN